MCAVPIVRGQQTFAAAISLGRPLAIIGWNLLDVARCRAPVRLGRARKQFSARAALPKKVSV